MKFFLALSYVSLLSLPSQIGGTPSSLRGNDSQDLEGPFSNLKCTFEARGDEDTCKVSLTDDGEPCSYCTMSSDGQEAGLCVNPDVAQQMEQLNPEISCTNTQNENSNVLTTGMDEFKCTFTALNDADKCSETKTSDGDEWCDYCTMDGPFGTNGVCVSPEHAESLEGLGGDTISCVSHNEIKSSQPITESNPVWDCNLSGTDNVTCLDPSKVNGSECVWCDAGIGGFCFPKSWEDRMSHFFQCGDQVTEEKEEEEEEEKQVSNRLHIDPSFFGSSCFKIGLTGATPDDCRESVDDNSGGHCIFCNAPKLGGIGLCMPPDFNGQESRFYTCDGDVYSSASLETA